MSTKPAGIPNGARRQTFEQLLIVESDDCVLWPHATNSKGYGLLSFNGKLKTVHSVVCEMHNGPRPTGLHAAHRCGVKACMNYRHIRWATPKENEADKALHKAQRTLGLRAAS